MHGAERNPWQNPKVMTTLLLVFASGAIIGALTMRLGLYVRSTAAAPRPAAQPLNDGTVQVFLQRYRDELDLTPDQTAKVKAVLNDYLMYYKTLDEQLEEIRLQLDDVRSTGKSRILEILTPEQQKKFAKMSGELRLK
jgi:Spy/CpxP family protein refolding chaperone